MDHEELNSTLAELGWTGLDLAMRVAAHPNTVSGWRTGKAPVPGAVRAYVLLAADLKRWREAISSKI